MEVETSSIVFIIIITSNIAGGSISLLDLNIIIGDRTGENIGDRVILNEFSILFILMVFENAFDFSCLNMLVVMTELITIDNSQTPLDLLDSELSHNSYILLPFQIHLVNLVIPGIDKSVVDQLLIPLHDLTAPTTSHFPHIRQSLLLVFQTQHQFQLLQLTEEVGSDFQIRPTTI